MLGVPRNGNPTKPTLESWASSHDAHPNISFSLVLTTTSILLERRLVPFILQQNRLPPPRLDAQVHGG